MNKVHVQAFNKMLRKKIGPFRFFACGEYGEQTKRPHYHLLIFGHFIAAKEISRIWKKGRVQVGELNKYTCQYVAGYVNKKLTKDGDKLLFGKVPEFSLMSRRPGIGDKAVAIIAEGASKVCFQNEFEMTGDVMNNINFGKEQMPLGRFMKNKIRDRLGMNTDENKDKRAFAQSVRSCMAFEELKEKAASAGRSIEATAMMERLQSVRKIETRSKIYNKRGKV